ncbi:MAG TPA: SDR family NAD(P)-dependent oxidoreductase, partial [Actinomycetota bacterium]|nr:SDR family NAD(P)-dependent oxidoreductase [Actinomycetota bacterium]
MAGLDPRDAVVVVTGASSGIGWSTAWAFAARGAVVVPTARRLERLENLAFEIRARGGTATPVACDVADRDSIHALAEAVRDLHGRCDVLVNNAGIPGGGHFDDVSEEQIEAVVRTNYLGVLYCTKAFLPLLLEAERGHIVNVASLAGRYALPGSAVYGSAKHAVVAFSESLDYELAARGVRVTTVNPGLVSTERFPHRDAGEGGGIRSRLVMRPERIAREIVRVVERGIAPERSVPRWLAAPQAARLLAPPLFRGAVRRVAAGVVRTTRVDEAVAPIRA